MKTVSLWAFIACVVLTLRAVFMMFSQVMCVLAMIEVADSDKAFISLPVLSSLIGGWITIFCYVALTLFFWKYYKKEKNKESED